MSKKSIFILVLSLCLISSAGAATVSWNFERGNDHGFTVWSVFPAGNTIDDPAIAGDELLTGVGGSAGLPDAGVAWTIGQPNQFDGLQPAVATGARVDGNGLLNYNLGTEDIPTGSGTLNTYNLNQDGDYLNAMENDQIATSPPVLLGENAVLTVWAYGGGVGTHAPEYDTDSAMMYTDGSSGIAVLSAEGDDIYAILATIHIQSQGTITENSLDLSAFSGRKIFIEVVDAFEGDNGWLAIDQIEITNSVSKTAGIIVQLVEGEPTMGFDIAQIDRLETLGYTVQIISQDDVRDGIFTKDDADALDVLVVSESPSSSATVSLAGTSTPVMHQEAYGWVREWALATRDSVNWFTGSEVDIVNDTHPILLDAGLSAGPMTFFDPANSWTSELVSSLAPGAELLAKINDGSNDFAIVFAIEKGAELANGTPAASRIVGFSLPGTEPTIPAEQMTDEAWALYDASIQWMDTSLPVSNGIDPGTDNLVAHYKLDGDVLDSSGNGNDGTIVGDPVFVEGVVGNALDLDGDGDYVDCGNSALFNMETNQMTVATWVTIRSVAHQWGALVAKGEHAWRLGNASNDPIFHFGINYGGMSDTTYFNGITAVGYDEWHHVAGVFDGATMMIYLDGVLDNSVPTTETIGINDANMLIGENPEATGRYWDGIVDEVYIYSRALSDLEIQFLAGL